MSEQGAPPTPPIAAVLFDFDDTLLDRRGTVERYLDHFVQRVGFSRETAAAYRARFHAIDGAGYTPRATVFETLVAEFAGCGSANDLVADWHVSAWADCIYIDGATEILAWCRRVGLRTAIVTNGRGALQRPKLERVGVIPLVDAVLVSGEEGIAKPDPELPRRAAERLGVAPEACAFVGDNPHTDIAGAVAAGMRAIWFERYVDWPDDVPRPVYSITELAALPELLRPRASP